MHIHPFVMATLASPQPHPLPAHQLLCQNGCLFPKPTSPPVPPAARAQVQEMMLGAMDSNVLERIGKLMNYMSLAGGCGRLSRGRKRWLYQQGWDAAHVW